MFFGDGGLLQDIVLSGTNSDFAERVRVRMASACAPPLPMTLPISSCGVHGTGRNIPYSKEIKGG